MRTHLLTAALIALGTALSAQGAPAAPAPGSQSPNVGDVPPDFTLTGATRFGVLNRPVRLSDLKGETVVLAEGPVLGVHHPDEVVPGEIRSTVP
jgi:hypothetical protein